MSNIIKVTKYQMRYLWMNTFNFLLYITATMIIEMIIILKLSNSQKSLQDFVPINTYSTAVVWMFIIGLIYFKPNFKFLLANGVSRKRYFWTNIPALAVAAAIWTGITALSPLAFKTFGNYTLLHERMYRGSNLASGIIWLFVLLFLLLLIGWCISMLYYRCSTFQKIIVSIVPFFLLTIFIFLNILSDEKISYTILRFFIAAAGLSTNEMNPYIAILSMFLLCAVFSCLNFLLIRKAQVKD